MIGWLVEYAKHNSGAEDAGEWCIWSAERRVGFFLFYNQKGRSDSSADEIHRDISWQAFNQ